MIERALEVAALWWGHQLKLAMLWYDKAPAWVQVVIAIVGVFTILGVLLLMQGAEFRRECELAEFRRWLKDRERAKRIRLPKGVL
jgi:hypothetical protein